MLKKPLNGWTSLSDRVISIRDLKSKHELIEGASDFHNKLRDVLISGKFQPFAAYQEVPIQFWDSTYDGALYVDWYLPLWKIAIELNGDHHYKPVDFSGRLSSFEKQVNFRGQQARDREKSRILFEHDTIMISVPYKEKSLISEDWLLSLIKSAELMRSQMGES